MGGPLRGCFSHCCMASGFGAPAPFLILARTNPPTFNQEESVMKKTSNQAAVLLDLEKQVGADQGNLERLVTQLTVLLMQQSREHAPDDRVAHTAKTLASCLRSRGDWEQAEQYAKMAANLERRHGGTCQPRGASPVHLKVYEPEASLSLGQEGANDPGPDQDSFGQSLRRLWRPRRGPWFGAWGWVLKRDRP